MGCGASKESVQVVPTTMKVAELGCKEEAAVDSPQDLAPEQPKGNAHSVAFEIPLDELQRPRLSTESKLSLPKLELSQTDLAQKLANTEARWKVGADLDQLLYGDLADAEQGRERKRKLAAKPKLKSQKDVTPEDLAALKQRLQEKEEAAKLNREREINKMQQKLARQEERARKVLERKKKMGASSSENLRLSWGSDLGLADHLDASTGASSVSLKDSDAPDSKSFLNNASRMGSGRSNATDDTDTTVDHVMATDPVKHATVLSEASYLRNI